ncbi:MAG TPA: amidohydrolase family protein [Acidimicrobiia bacterium]|nr:amidohydrolase family protein [Acidimicrobiia bacterium]
MKTHFTDWADLDFPLVDADAHVNEPPELWQERVPAKWRDRAPRLEHRDDGDWWAFDDGKRIRPVGLNAVAGLSVCDFRSEGLRYADIRPGSFETKARLHDLDLDGVFAQVLYPSVALEGARLYTGERELQLACVRAYNEWITELCEPSGGRLFAQAVIPTTGVDDAVAEVEAALALGHRGVILSCYPNGTLDPSPEDDRFWGVVEDAGLPLSVHIGSFMRPRAGMGKWPDMHEQAFLGLAGGAKAGAHAIELASDLLFSGVCERFPGIKVVLVEANIGWIPSMLEQLDDMFLRYRWFNEAVDRMLAMPSELFHRNFFATFIVDTVGLELRHRMNLGHLMWSTDYPHTPSDWPNTRVTVERQFRGLPLDEVRRLLNANAVDLYRLEIPATRPLPGRP